MSVSLVEIYGRRYVSALRLDWGEGNSSILGYPHAISEVAVTMSPVEISGPQLAHDPSGIRGLAVVSATGVSSNWGGDHEGILARRLVFETITAGHNSIRYLKGGFDVRFSFRVGYSR